MYERVKQVVMEAQNSKEQQKHHLKEKMEKESSFEGRGRKGPAAGCRGDMVGTSGQQVYTWRSG